MNKKRKAPKALKAPAKRRPLSLATLSKASKRRVIAHVVRHCVKQGVRSYDPDSGACLYRGPNGTSCGAGCLMSDKEYRKLGGKNIEGASWCQLTADGKVPRAHSSLIRALQISHDYYLGFGIRSFLASVKKVAKTCGVPVECVVAAAKRAGWPKAR